jgi:LuxR family maltose regulon positive regulatory protein
MHSIVRAGLEPRPSLADSTLIKRIGAGIPVLPAGVVTRGRLLDLVELGVRGSLTLVSASAGTGKTVLVSSWAHTSPSRYPVVWLTMSRDDGSDQFWPLLPAALRRSDVAVSGLRVPPLGASPSEAWLSRLAAAIVAHALPVVLVLDEADAGDPSLHRNLATLIRQAGDRLRVVLLTRSDPALPLNAYRLDNQLTEIRAADLSFHEDEAAQLFELSGISLTAPQSATLVRRTSGWGGGLRLAAMGLRDKVDIAAAVADFSGNQDNVSTYLSAEVLESQTPALREILLRTSVVDALSPGLFEALTGQTDGQRVMAFMARGNSFIETVPDFPGWYRYQPVFREFLRTQLAYEQPELVRELHREAAFWFAHNGFLTRAVRHAATEGAWGDAAGYLIEDLSIGALVADIGTPGQAASFYEMPEDTPGTAASLVRAALALGTGDPAACRRALAEVRSSVADDPASSAACALSLAFLETLDAVARSDFDAGLAFASAAEQQLRGSHPDAARSRPELALLLALGKARLHLWSGDMNRAAALLASAGALDSEVPGCQRLNVVGLGLRGLVEAMTGHLLEASQHADAAEALARAAGVEVDTWSWEVPLTRAWVLVDEMDLDCAAHQLGHVGASAPASDDLAGVVVALVRARLLQAQGQRGPALDLLSEAREVVRGRHAALATPEFMRRASMGAPAGGRQPGNRSKPGREHADQSSGAVGSHARPWRYAVTPVGNGSLGSSQPSGPLVEELTAKELEVLGHLAELLSTTEIATVMFISVNTVRTHIRNILRKLAVGRRNEAVRRAWELDLLGPRVGRWPSP